MNYDECIEWLYSFEKFGIKLGLDRISHFCKELDNPQDRYKIVHVGGTNGKGSVCHFLQSILTQNGYKVGLYTSPHLQRLSERFIIDGVEIEEKDVVLIVGKIKPVVEEMIEKQNTPTFFEIVTAMAFQYFKDKSVDFAIVEVGLGGRFDATNIVNPELSIITNVSLEHQKVLGKRIEDIAFEKAGIIKEEVPIITAATDEALEKIKSIAEEKNSFLKVINEKSWKRVSFDNSVQEFLIKGLLNEYHVKTSMLGLHQGENIALSIAAIENLQMNGLFVTDQSIIEGIERTNIAGRMEIVGSEPKIILDGAHNIEAIKFLKRTIQNDFKFGKLILVIGILSDKNIKKILEIIVPISDIIISTKSSNKRACDPKKILDIAIKIRPKIQFFEIEDINEAIIKAQNIAQNRDLICITGSLFTVGEARDFFHNK